MYKEHVLRYFRRGRKHDRGAITRCAQLLGIRPAAVSAWGDIIPKGTAYELEVRTAGALKVDPSLYIHRPAVRRATIPKPPKAQRCYGSDIGWE